MSLVEATQASVGAATHLTDEDAGAVEAMLTLARKIDAWDVIVQWALEDLEESDRPGRPRVPENDNVSLSAYLKYAESLGLTPAGRGKVGDKKPEQPAGKLAQLRSAGGTGSTGRTARGA